MTPVIADRDLTLYEGDAVAVLAGLPECADAVVTSPPYMDARPDYAAFPLERYAELFSELGRVVRGGMLWNVGRVWRGGRELLWWVELLQAAEAAGWELWDTLVWIKPNANPIHGRIVADSHEYVLAFGRPGVVFNADALRRPHAESTKARFARSWSEHRGVKSAPGKDRRNGGRGPLNPLGARPRSYLEAFVGRAKGNPHPAPMPASIAEELVALATLPGETVLDPFFGSGTTGLAARELGRSCIGIEIRADYCAIAAERTAAQRLAI